MYLKAETVLTKKIAHMGGRSRFYLPPFNALLLTAFIKRFKRL